MSESVPPSSSDPVEVPARLANDPSVRRKLLTGLALVLALASIYVGMFGSRAIQIVLAAGATISVVGALASGSRRGA